MIVPISAISFLIYVDRRLTISTTTLDDENLLGINTESMFTIDDERILAINNELLS